MCRQNISKEFGFVKFYRTNKPLHINSMIWDSASPICLMGLYHFLPKSMVYGINIDPTLNLTPYNDLAKNNSLHYLTKIKYLKGTLCPLVRKEKAIRASHPPKPIRIPRRDDYSRYMWVHFLRKKDVAPEEIIKLLRNLKFSLQAPVIIVRTDNDIEFKNHVLQEYC
ncbi:retrovirus-related pol polyprotein from transposon TNT 1-94 [Tanacetum coccineum]